MFSKFTEVNLGTGHDFELEVKYLLMQLGFIAGLTGDNDKGVDIIADAPTPGKPKFYIQCKYHHKTVGLEAIQQVYAGAAIRGNNGYPVVFTSSMVTPEARDSAAKLNVEIIAYPELKDLALGYETQRVIRKTRYGLMGLLAGLSVKDHRHILTCSKQFTSKSKTNQTVTEDSTTQEDLKAQRQKAIKQLYDEAHQHQEEIADLEQQKSKHKQLILELQKEAMLLSLDYG